MFGRAGCAYVYSIHAKYCMNVVTEREGVGSAVLIRAIEPAVGISLMQQRRGLSEIRDLCRGPARLCQALDIGPDLNGHDLTTASKLWLEEMECIRGQHHCSPRIGVTSAKEAVLRFFIPHNIYVSGTRVQNRPRILFARAMDPTKSTVIDGA
jgi:DNA-3-methyladenine glycosylase